MRYRINLENGPSEPFDESQLVSLVMAGAITPSTKVQAENAVDWEPLATALPIIAGVRPTHELITALRTEVAKDRSRVVVAKIDMPFSNMMNFILEFTLASIPALLIFSLIVGCITAVVLTLMAGWGASQ